MNWLRYNWSVLVLLATSVALLWAIFHTNSNEDSRINALPTPPKTSTQKAWKNWEDHWSMNPLDDAWAHKKPEDYLYYIKDPRTNLCFAVATPLGDGGFMASVPCNKVQDLLKKK